MVSALYAMAVYAICVTLGAPDSTSKVVLALYAMALYANSKLNAYAREYMQTHLHCHFRENDSVNGFAYTLAHMRLACYWHIVIYA